jgi:hypothetical protein
MIQDQYEEEYFVSFLKPRQNDDLQNQSNSNSQGSTLSGTAAPTASEGLVYKYYSELSTEETSHFNCRPDITSYDGKAFVQDRGNILGVSTPNLNRWVKDILETGDIKTEQDIQQERPMSAIVKLYDRNINSFKLNEQVTFIGVLEFNHQQQEKPQSQDQIPQNTGDAQDQQEQQMMDSFFTGIPNENQLPHIHAITTRKMTVLQCPDLLRYCKVDKESLLNIFGENIA